MTIYQTLGYDIRYHDTKLYSSDLNIWNRNDAFYNKMIAELNIQENEFQLMSLNQEKLKEVFDYINRQGIKKQSSLCCISLEVERSVFESLNMVYQANDCCDCIWKDVGFDICDLQGFFSFFDMQDNITKEQFDSMDFVSQLFLCQKANFLIPQHSPFIFLKIKKLVDI